MEPTEPASIDLNGEIELRIRFRSIRRVAGDQYTVGFEIYGLGHDEKEQLFVELLQEVQWEGSGSPQTDQIVHAAAQLMVGRFGRLGTSLSSQYPRNMPL